MKYQRLILQELENIKRHENLIKQAKGSINESQVCFYQFEIKKAREVIKHCKNQEETKEVKEIKQEIKEPKHQIWNLLSKDMFKYQDYDSLSKEDLEKLEEKSLEYINN